MSDKEELVKKAVDSIMDNIMEESNLGFVRACLEDTLEKYTKNELEYIIYGE